MEKQRAPCSSCVRETTHEVLFEVSRASPDDDSGSIYKLLSCAGCGTISMMDIFLSTFDGTENYAPGDALVQFYPAPVSRKEPEWASWLDFKISELDLVSLLKEIYQAVHGGQYRLAAMGIRALLEQVMVTKVGDVGGFDKKLDAFQKAGFISLIQRDAMRATLDVGDAAMHRAFRPDERELQTALDITEGVMAAIYSHQKAAEKLGDRVPPRKAPPRAPGDK